MTGRTGERIAQNKRAVLVRSPQWTSHKWCELVSSGRLVCRCHISLLCYGFFFALFLLLLLSLKPRFFIQPFFVLRSACVPTVIRLSFFFLFFLDMSLFPIIFVPLPLYLCMESTSHAFSFRVMFFYLVTTV